MAQDSAARAQPSLEAPPFAVVSLRGATLRLELGGGRRRVFPVGVGRPGKGTVGVLHTGPDPRDARFYDRARREPAFHRGLPFLRLISSARDDHVWAVHGPVTPTLIWGNVSAGCVRMRPDDLRVLFGAALRHPGMTIRVVPELDVAAGQPATPDPIAAGDPACPERALGVRRLRRISVGRELHDRVCGGVDHWYSLELEGGDLVAVQVRHRGGLRVELYGIRGMTPVAEGKLELVHLVPVVSRNRGDRYLRIFSDGDGALDASPQSYTLSATVGTR